MFLEEYLCGHSFVLAQESLQLLFCAVLGFACMRLLTVTRVEKKSTAFHGAPPVRVCEPSPIAKWTRLRREGGTKTLEVKSRQPELFAPSALATALPVDIASSLAVFVDLADIAQLAAASQSSRDCIWQPEQVWFELSNARGLKGSLPSVTEGLSAERFRQTFFRIDAVRPQTLLQGARNGRSPAVEILDEAAHMLRGLMPQDDKFALSCVLESAVVAIWALEVSKDGALPMESFLKVARRRDDIISSWQLQNIEDSWSAWLTLDASMEASFQQAYNELPAVQAEALGYWPDMPLEDFSDDWMNEMQYEFSGGVNA
jgi:hypothetical protein